MRDARPVDLLFPRDPMSRLEISGRRASAEKGKAPEECIIVPCDTSFIQTYCNITSDEVNRRVQATVSYITTEKLHVFGCIGRGGFAASRIDHAPWYPSMRQQFSRPGFRVFELGCCVGTDSRKMLHDGLPSGQLTVSDLHDGYWNARRAELFRDEPGVQTIFLDFAAPWERLEQEQQLLPGSFDAVVCLKVPPCPSSPCTLPGAQSMCVRAHALVCLNFPHSPHPFPRALRSRPPQGPSL